MFELGVAGQFTLVELVGFVGHFGEKDGDDAIEVLEDQLWDDLQNVLDNADEFCGVKLRHALYVWTACADHAHHGYVEYGAELHEGVLEQ